MAKKKATKRRALTATKRDQVRRVREKLESDEGWLKEMAWAFDPVEALTLEAGLMLKIAEDAVNDPAKLKLSGPFLRQVAQRMRALGEFARLVGLYTVEGDDLTVPEQDAAWDRWHVRFARALKLYDR